jgi:SAM-dependent methyltransferase
VAEIIVETILDCKRNFDDILEIGARNGELGKKIATLKNAKQLFQADYSAKMVQKNKLDLVMDEENLCFKEQSFDLVLSNLNLHFINDVPKNLLAIRDALKPGGMIIASFFGEENLKELKEVFLQTEQKFYDGVTPRIAPNIDVKTAGMLLQKAGFADVVAQKHSFEVEYQNPKKLLEDLKTMGEGNIINARSRKFLTKSFLFDLTNLYQKLYCRADNSSTATFEIVILSGWKKK